MSSVTLHSAAFSSNCQHGIQLRGDASQSWSLLHQHQQQQHQVQRETTRAISKIRSSGMIRHRSRGDQRPSLDLAAAGLGFHKKEVCGGHSSSRQRCAAFPSSSSSSSRRRAAGQHHHQRPVTAIRGSSSNSNGGGSSEGGRGDPEVQRMLVDMLRVQMGGIKMSNMVDERSERMRKIARSSYDDFDKIASRAMKGVDDFSERVLRELDAGAHAIEKDLEIARLEMEDQERKFEEFERRVMYSRNEGLFFKNLYTPEPRNLRGEKINQQKSSQTTGSSSASGGNISSTYRQILYGALSVVVVSFLWSLTSAFIAGVAIKVSKVSAYTLILMLISFQIVFEKQIMGEDEAPEDQE